MSDALRGEGAAFWATGMWRLIVTDDTDTVMFTLDLQGTLSPAASSVSYVGK